jgi:CHAD domain-containing protein
MATTVIKTVGELAVEALVTYLTRAETYEEAVLQDRDPEDLHQLRVNLRRLRTAMQVFDAGIMLPKGGAEPQVAVIARRLGNLRDLDVILDTLNSRFLPDLPEGERKTLDVIFRYLAKQRKKAFKETKSTLKSARYHTLKSQLMAWVAEPLCTVTAGLDINTVLPELTLPLVSHLWLHPGWWVGAQVSHGKPQVKAHQTVETVDTLVATHHKQLHSLRKQLKRVRYQLKFVSEFYGDRLDSDLERFADLQTVLGDLQDSLIMSELLSSALPNWDTQLPTLKALLANNRHRAWKQWQAHQEHYLKLEVREALRQTLMHPGVTTPTPAPEPVTATSKAPTAKTAKTSTATKSTTNKSTRTKSTSTARKAAEPNGKASAPEPTRGEET